MTKALRRDPVALYSVLKARRKDLLIARRGAVQSGDRNSAQTLSAAMEQIDEALAAVVAHLNEVAAAEEADQAADIMEAEQSAEPSADKEPLDEEPSADMDPMVDEEPSADEEVSPEDSATDEVLEEDGAGEEADQEPTQSSVAMKATLRREMGDVAADLLDDYATKIQKSVTTFFDNLTKKALDLGAEDPADSSNSLREQLLTEIGRRGLEKVEPTFVEWRAGLIKQLMRDINKTFEVPQTESEEKPELELPEGSEEPAEGEEAPFEGEEATAEEEPAEEAEEEVVIEEEAPAEEPATPMKMPAAPTKMPASVTASFGSAKPISFTIHRDMKPGAARSIKLT